jgi:SAM-dependent methyltransferase
MAAYLFTASRSGLLRGTARLVKDSRHAVGSSASGRSRARPDAQIAASATTQRTASPAKSRRTLSVCGAQPRDHGRVRPRHPPRLWGTLPPAPRQCIRGLQELVSPQAWSKAVAALGARWNDEGSAIEGCQRNLTQQAHNVDRSDLSSSLAPQFPIRDTRVVLRVPEILRLCRGKKVLHLGCTDSPYTTRRGENLLHNKLSKVTPSEKLWGLDISSDGVSILRGMGFENIICGDVEDLPAALHGEKFDVIVAGEIIEHIMNPGNFLNSLKNVMGEGSELILTTVNAFSIKGTVHSFLRREKVHPDHNYYFSYKTMEQLLVKTGYVCNEIYYYQEIEGQGLARGLDQVFWLTTKVTPVWADGIVVRASVGPSPENHEPAA